MSLGPAVRAAFRTIHARPASILPFYVAALAVPVAAQAIVLTGVVVAYGSLTGSGRLEEAYVVLERAGPIPIDDPEVIQGDAAVGEALSEAMAGLMTPTVMAILAVAVLTAVVAVTVLDAVATAGQLHAVYGALSGRSGSRAGVEGAFRHWLTFLALTVFELLAFLVGAALMAVAVGFAVAVPLAGVPIAFGLAFPWIGASILFRLTFAFAGPVAVVDDVGVIDALRGSFGYVTSHPLSSFGYGVLAIVGFSVVGTVAAVFTVLGAPTVGSLLSTIVLLPVLGLLKTVLYADETEQIDLPPEPTSSTSRRLRTGLRTGVAEVGRFGLGHPLSVVASTALFAGGIVVGLRAGGQVDSLFVASIEARLGTVNPVGSFFEYAANNWTVAAAGGFSGFAFGLPSISMLVFNGLNIGLLYGIETDPQLLLAFVVPHGLLEIPSLLLSGALGLHLGAVAVRYVRGSIDRSRLADEVDRAFRVAVGLAVLLVAAALIEAVVSPYYWRFLSI